MFRKRIVSMSTLAEMLQIISFVILIISSGFYFRHLEQCRREKKLSMFERSMYISIQFAFFWLAVSLLFTVFV